jgi:hypothetical protein
MMWLRSRQGGTVPIDRTTLGEAVEATAVQLRELDEQRYFGLHNAGHGFIAQLSNPEGVMTSPTTAIRDQVFWRWHKHIDDVNAGWQDTQPKISFTDAPPVLLRPALTGRPPPGPALTSSCAALSTCPTETPPGRRWAGSSSAGRTGGRTSLRARPARDSPRSTP